MRSESYFFNHKIRIYIVQCRVLLDSLLVDTVTDLVGWTFASYLLVSHSFT